MAAPDYPKPNVQSLLDKVSSWKQNVEPMDLGVRKALAIVTCMDSRVMPASMFGLQLGDAEYIRNAGGRVTPDVIRSLVIANELLHCKVIFVIHHTDCGGQAAVRHADLLEKRVMQVAKGKASQASWGQWVSSWIETLSFGLLVKASNLGALYPIKPPNNEGLLISVKKDVEKLKASPFISPSIEIHGFIYHTHTGDLEEVAKYLPKH